MSNRAKALADRLLDGAEALSAYAESLNEEQWVAKVPGDGRSVGVVVHHVASVYPVEIELARTLGAGNPIEGVSWQVIHDMNGDHAANHADIGKDEAIALLRTHAKEAARAVASFSDAELDSAATVSLNADAPLTAQFFIEDHALRHSYHHLQKIKEATG